ncbi:hypothetical protein ACFLRA_01370 [Bdellovibrionota bacterium]
MLIDVKFSLSFGAGVFGGLITALFIWLTGFSGINKIFGIKIKPEWDTSFIYPKLIWGGVWGLAFYPFLINPNWQLTVLHGFLISLLPTLVQWFYVFPKIAKAGIFGKKLGKPTWFYVIVANFFWALGVLYWIEITRL